MNKFPDDIENLEAKNLKYWSNFFAKEAEKSQNVLRSFGFEKSDLCLSESLNQRFNALMSVYQQLGLEDAIENRFSHIDKVQQLIIKKLTLEKTLAEWDEKKTSMTENLVRLNVSKECLTRDFKELTERAANEKDELDKVDGELKFIRNKLEKYQNQINMYQKNTNIDKNKTHEAILVDYEAFQANKIKLEKLRSDLKIYDDLQPNTNLAKTKIEELAKEIEFVDRQVDNIMMGLSL